VNGWRGQEGRGGLTLVVLLVVVGIGGYLAWAFVHQQPGGQPVGDSAAAAQSGQEKALSFAQAQDQARRTGRPVPVAKTFDDAEITALANQAAQAKGLPVDQISLHATGQGTIQGTARAHVAGQDVPVTLEGVPQVRDDRVTLNVTSTRVGAIPLPGPISDQATQAIREPLQLGEPISGFQNLTVSVTEGRLTVSGTALPS
jgi:hypothetical protein